MKSCCFLIWFLLFAIACNTDRKEVNDEVITTEESNFVSSAQMIEIPSGTYIPFFGQDTVKEVHVNTFWMDQTLVSNEDFLSFVKSNPQWSKSKILRLYADENYLADWESDFDIPKGLDPKAPVTNVSWYAAKAYAQSLGKRLPTVDEWEYVGVASTNSPNASMNSDFTNMILASYKTRDPYKIKVKSGMPNYYGIYDMYESVWEWTMDFNSVMMTGESRNSNIKNEDLFCAGASLTATDLKNYAAFVRFAMRGSVKANYCIKNLGFRCVKDISSKL